jgi:hypothetical protein
VIVSKESPVMKALSNVPGADCVAVHALNAELLAPGTHPGRITLCTDSAVKRVAAEGLFTNNKKSVVLAKASVKSAVDSIVARALAQSETMKPAAKKVNKA